MFQVEVELQVVVVQLFESVVVQHVKVDVMTVIVVVVLVMHVVMAQVIQLVVLEVMVVLIMEDDEADVVVVQIQMVGGGNGSR